MNKFLVKLDSNENQNQHIFDISKCVSTINPRLYPDVKIVDLRNSLANIYKVSSDEIFCSNGSDYLIKVLTFALVSHTEEVLIPEIAFPTYEIAAKVKECAYKLIPLKNHYIDLEETIRNISPKTKLIWLSNPHNPTGTLHNRDSIRDFLKQVPREVLVVLDEAYIEYLEPNTIDSINLYKDFENVIILRTLSKAYGLAGARVGYGIARQNIIDKLNTMIGPFDLNSYAQKLAVECLGYPEYVDYVRNINSVGLNQYKEMCDTLSLEYIDSSTSFIMIKLVDADRLCSYLTSKGVFIKNGVAIGMPGWIRISVGTVEQNELIISLIMKYFKEN